MELVEVGPARRTAERERRILATDDKVALHRTRRRRRRPPDRGGRLRPPGRVPQMADAEAVLRPASPGDAGVPTSAWCSTGAGSTGPSAAPGWTRSTYVVVATDDFSRRNQGMSTRRGARRLGARSPPAPARPGLRTTRHPRRRRSAARSRARCRRARCATWPPRRRGRRRTRSASPTPSASACPGRSPTWSPRCASSPATAALRAHFHNTRNTGYANAMAALDAGVTRPRRQRRRHRRLPVRPGGHRQHRHRGPARTCSTAPGSRPAWTWRRWPRRASGSAGSST